MSEVKQELQRLQEQLQELKDQLRCAKHDISVRNNHLERLHQAYGFFGEMNWGEAVDLAIETRIRLGELVCELVELSARGTTTASTWRGSLKTPALPFAEKLRQHWAGVKEWLEKNIRQELDGGAVTNDAGDSAPEHRFTPTAVYVQHEKDGPLEEVKLGADGQALDINQFVIQPEEEGTG